MSHERRNPKRNASGCMDMTAYKAISNVKEEENYHKLLHGIFSLCNKFGFRIEGRIVLVSKNTGRKWE